jgi:hypothetical protein
LKTQLLVCFFLLCFGAISSASEQLPFVNEGDADFTAIEDLKDVNSGTTVEDGFVANPKDWPASFFFTAKGKDNQWNYCTSVLIGPSVVLTAAHCVGDGKHIRLKFEKRNTTYQGVCTRCPGFITSDWSSDYALCKLDCPIIDIQCENIGPQPTLTSNSELMITGFGCTSLENQSLDGLYRIGISKIDKVQESDNYIRTQGIAAICNGDSGGPAFFILDKSLNKRVIVAVNSRRELDSKCSLLASLNTKAAKNFISSWKLHSNCEICDGKSDLKGCRP